MTSQHQILNAAIADKEKFKEIMLLSVGLMGEARNDKYNFYTQEALDIYKELCPLLENMGFSYDIHLNVPSFKLTLLHVMSIVWLLKEGETQINSSIENTNLDSDNVIDFLKYKNKGKRNSFTNSINHIA